MVTLLVGIGECRFSSRSDCRLVSYALGSCIGLSAWDPETKTGGMLHCMLPDSGMNSLRAANNPGVFADTGLIMLLRGCEKMGASRSGLILHAIGAAGMLDNSRHFDVGNRNAQSLKSALQKEGLRLGAELLGGGVSRSISLEVASGKVTVREGATPWRELPARRAFAGRFLRVPGESA